MEQKNNMAFASMILGISSIVLSCCCFLGMILGSLGILLGALSRGDGKMNGQAKAGVVTGVIGIILSIGAIIVLVALMAN